MKKDKKGFSLAEILLTLGIVAVIATLGFTATKRSIDNAYNLYIYTGYKGLTDAIFNANYKGLKIEDTNNGNSKKFLNEIASTLNTQRSDTQIDAPNGVSYIFNFEPADTDPKYHTITFIVPYKKFVSNNNAHENLSFELRYYYDFNIILPTSGLDNNGSGINIFTRKDLLPFYIDNGRVGRQIDGVYQPKEYISWQEAWCRVKDSIGLNVHSTGCTGIAPENGFLRVENPRKAF